jgi:hypothetical protein
LFNFRDSFGVSDKSLAIFTRDIDKHLRDYLFDGVENLKKLDDIISDEEALDESLFFYPIIGSIKNLLSNLSDLSPLNQ